MRTFDETFQEILYLKTTALDYIFSLEEIKGPERPEERPRISEENRRDPRVR